MAVHVKGGTPVFGPSLCDTCSNAHVEKGYRESEALVFCQATWPEHRVKFRVRECSAYLDSNRQDLDEMRKMAWILLPREGKRVRGFVSPSQIPDGESQIEIELDASK